MWNNRSSFYTVSADVFDAQKYTNNIINKYMSELSDQNWQQYYIADYLLNDTNKKTPMKITSIMKRILDADTQTLFKAGYLNSDLQITTEGKEALFALMFEQNKVALVKEAEDKLANDKN